MKKKRGRRMLHEGGASADYEREEGEDSGDGSAV
jgi:hypothetical protein